MVLFITLPEVERGFAEYLDYDYSVWLAQLCVFRFSMDPLSFSLMDLKILYISLSLDGLFSGALLTFLSFLARNASLSCLLCSHMSYCYSFFLFPFPFSFFFFSFPLSFSRRHLCHFSMSLPGHVSYFFFLRGDKWFSDANEKRYIYAVTIILLFYQIPDNSEVNSIP